MGLFRSDEEKARAAEERAEAERTAAAQQAEADRVAAEAAHAATPVGQAEAAMRRGDRFCEVQVSVGRQEREAMWGERTYAADDRVDSSAQVLGEIEELGWRLEHVGYVFRVTGESSSEKAFMTGQQTAVSGDTVGIYLFRNPTVGGAGAPA